MHVFPINWAKFCRTSKAYIGTVDLFYAVECPALEDVLVLI